jgi:hypothetical protein
MDNEKEISRMFPDWKQPMTLDEELAFFMHRFNIDLETIKTMPAFEEHLKPLFPEEKKNIL